MAHIKQWQHKVIVAGDNGSVGKSKPWKPQVTLNEMTSVSTIEDSFPLHDPPVKLTHSENLKHKGLAKEAALMNWRSPIYNGLTKAANQVCTLCGALICFLLPTVIVLVISHNCTLLRRPRK